jgi:gas vesicle structural protein
MTVTTTYRDDVVSVPRAGTLYDVIDIILDRGMVIDVFLRVSLVGIEILKIDVRIVIASVDTYLRFAEACNRIDLEEDTRSRTVAELFGGAGSAGPAGAVAKKGVKKAARTTGRKAKEALTGGGSDEEEDMEQEDLEQEEAAVPERSGRDESGKRRGGRTRRSREESGEG